ncbi:MAG TPA: type II toxin-antitoxin system RelE/ParE family toxin [Ginsengibacter sp.]
MSYKIFSIPPFDKQLKRLSKKYPSLKIKYSQLLNELERNPTLGVFIGNDCYKIRIAIASKNKGKSGGARVITYVQVKDKSVFLSSIFDKSEDENIPDSELKFLLKLIK